MSTSLQPNAVDEWDEIIRATIRGYRKGRTMNDAFLRMCADTQPHVTLDFMDHHARRARNAILNAYNRIVRKARIKGIIH